MMRSERMKEGQAHIASCPKPYLDLILMTHWTLSEYEVDRRYGGPEEGGWYYTEGRLVRTIKRFSTRQQALDYRDAKCPESDRFTHFNIYEGEAPEFFPNRKPTYE